MSTTIIFERPAQIYLPELEAYQVWLQRHHPSVQVQIVPVGMASPAADVRWRFMGLDRQLPSAGELRVHEYGSLSVPPFARLKDQVKRWVNVRPGRRVFLNPAVVSGLAFDDQVPARQRDMGIAEAFFDVPPVTPQFDLVYAGSLYRTRQVMDFLARFARSGQASLLVIGEVLAGDAQRLSASGRITFAGRQPYADVPALLRQGRYALNLLPDVYPFNLQTSTKLLEYAALGLPVLSTPTRWVREFAAQRGARFFWLENGLPDWAAVERFDFLTPDVRDLGWDQVITASGIFDFLGKAG